MASDRWWSTAFVLEEAEGEHFPSVLLELQLQQFELDFPGVVSGKAVADGLQRDLFTGEAEFDSEGELLRQLVQFELDFLGVVAAGDFKYRLPAAAQRAQPSRVWVLSLGVVVLALCLLCALRVWAPCMLGRVAK